jgi:hypothetical protein
MFLSHQNIEEIAISAVIIRSNGSTEDLGIIVEYQCKKSLLKKFINFIKGVMHGIFE